VLVAWEQNSENRARDPRKREQQRIKKGTRLHNIIPANLHFTTPTPRRTRLFAGSTLSGTANSRSLFEPVLLLGENDEGEPITRTDLRPAPCLSRKLPLTFRRQQRL
jgi:hypothetical protein